LYASYSDVNSMLVVINIDTLQAVDRITFGAQLKMFSMILCTLVDQLKLRQ